MRADRGPDLAECRRALGVSQQAGRREIKLAFRRRVRECHPDMNPSRPDAEAELKRVVLAYRTLMERASRSRPGGLDRRFRQTQERVDGFRAAPAPGAIGAVDVAGWQGAAHGAVVGFAVRLAWLLVRGGVKGINFSPTPHWSILGLGASGALLCAMIAANTPGVGRKKAYEFGALAGLVTGAAAAIAYNLVMDAFATDPARAWSLAAFAAVGGLVGAYVEVRARSGADRDEAGERPALQPVLNAAAATLAVLLVVPIGLFALWQAGVALRGIL